MLKMEQMMARLLTIQEEMIVPYNIFRHFKHFTLLSELT
jgi:hypothetical protein